MITTIHFKNTESSPAIREYAATKSERLKKYFEGKIHVTWTFSLESHGRICHCHLLGNHMDYFGETETGDFHEGIDLTIEKVERQIKKHKEIVRGHHHKE